MPSTFSRGEFLEALFGEHFRRFEGFILVMSSRHLEHQVNSRFYPRVEALDRQVYADDQSVFFGVCPRAKMKTGPEGVRHVSSLWAGLDFEPDGYSGRESYFKHLSLAALAVRRFPLTPSIIVESGRGLHLYWLLDELAEVDDVAYLEGLLGNINEYFLCRRRVGVDSLLRLPGTANGKVGLEPLLCKVKYLNTDIRYELEDFERVFANGPVATPAYALPGSKEIPKAVRAAPAANKPPISDESAPQVMELSSEVSQLSSEVENLAIQIAERSTTALKQLALDDLADLVADRIVEKLRTELVDEVVTKLAQRLTPPKVQ